MLIDEVVPNFHCRTTRGEFDFYDYTQNSWCILLGHTKAFTPICTTDLVKAARLVPEFEKRNFKLIAMTSSTVEENKEWSQDILSLAKLDKSKTELPFPIISDTDCAIALKLGMIKDTYKNSTSMRRCLIIAPDSKLKASIWYHDCVGRNYYELLRVLDSLLLTQKYNCQLGTPADWLPGDRCFALPTVDQEDLDKLFPGGADTIRVPSGKQYMRQVEYEMPTHGQVIKTIY